MFFSYLLNLYLYFNLFYFTILFDNPVFIVSIFEDLLINNSTFNYVYNYNNDFQVLSVYVLISTLLSFLLFTVSYILGTSVIILDLEKLSAYECGFAPVEDSRKSIDLKFYKTAILFLIFDIEVLFLIPWCICLLTNSILNLNFVKTSLSFLIILLLGIIIECKDKLFNW